LAAGVYDVAVVGAGVIGLAHALAAARSGARVIVIDRDAQANGASIRNFGLITVTGQQRGDLWRLARRTRDVWAEIAGPAGIAIESHGLAMLAQRPEAAAVLEAFAGTEMAEDAEWIPGSQAAHHVGPLQPAMLSGILLARPDLRVDSRLAIPALAKWLVETQRVEIRRGVAVLRVEPGRLETTIGEIAAHAVVVCPGDDLASLYPERLADLKRCKLQMLRLAPPPWRTPWSFMSDLSLVRYAGYAALPEAAALRTRLAAERPDHLANGVHLIAVHNADGSLVVGDSHHYAATPDPFRSSQVDDLILNEFERVTGWAPPPVLERWTGTYASGPDQFLVDTPAPGVRLVAITNGVGASIAFGLAERVMSDLLTTEREGLG
jgi:FAD dependent oxidoreductase TIGR03364